MSVAIARHAKPGGDSAVRNMSFALTTQQVRDRQKTVTRRLGWKTLQPGTLLQPIVKGMGLGKGGKVEKIGGPIRVLSVTRERLFWMAAGDCALEGFPDLTPALFVPMFVDHNKCGVGDFVTRIEFEYVGDPA